MKTRKIGRILTVMFLSGGLMTGCQKKQTVVLPEKEQKKRQQKSRAKTKKHRKFLLTKNFRKIMKGH